MMEELLGNIIDLKRHLNTIEHMIYVSCKFTRTTEMLKTVMETIVVGYEEFFNLSFKIYVSDTNIDGALYHKIQLLNDALSERGIVIDLSDYFLLKKLLISDFESVGQYRKNLSMISYIDGQEYVITRVKLLEFYENLKLAFATLKPIN